MTRNSERQHLFGDLQLRRRFFERVLLSKCRAEIRIRCFLRVKQETDEDGADCHRQSFRYKLHSESPRDEAYIADRSIQIILHCGPELRARALNRDGLHSPKRKAVLNIRQYDPAAT